ncbi:NAD(P)-dependent dehydrogenase (short-subunit alcohol dehydrogenase family) [Streptomyces aurantiacus]|uniref:SDR family NAD(P)-dependent oxidoreductase n=1 Tax=Streptomyces aurantiacus TaxID=47760 RepID=UPI00278DD5B9|nr:glucose 1-dehydrogenase [Streptomyces aurantiacus]MDQ0773848.1 NAD(P)-dependent dehydrogenase (short-subunit alcohol dehydrogenase family) [Streptomyces aurantiacus]
MTLQGNSQDHPHGNLQDKTALVTGATSGIGRAVAQRLARHGARVTVTGRDKQRGEEVVAGIEAEGGRARFLAADLADFDDVRRLAGEAADVDILVNNAGVALGGPSEQTAQEDFDLVFAVNVKAPFYLTAAIAPRMAARGGGAIISISTMAATIGMSGLAAYGASKAAIEALTRSWTAEFGSRGVRVNVVAPGPTRTPASAAMGEMFDTLAAAVPAQRGADPDEIAAAVCFLASDEAGFIYGAVLPADGGRVAI